MNTLDDCMSSLNTLFVSLSPLSNLVRLHICCAAFRNADQRHSKTSSFSNGALLSASTFHRESTWLWPLLALPSSTIFSPFSKLYLRPCDCTLCCSVSAALGQTAFQ